PHAPRHLLARLVGRRDEARRHRSSRRDGVDSPTLRRLRPLARAHPRRRAARARHPRRHHGRRNARALPSTTGDTLMRNRILLFALTLLVAPLVAAPLAAAATPTPGSPEFARSLLQHFDDMYRGEQSHGVMQMEVKTRHWERSMSLESWSKGKDY